MKYLNLISIFLIGFAMQTFAQKTVASDQFILGDWKLKTSVSNLKMPCEKYFTTYTISFDKSGHYSNKITSSLGDLTTIEKGKYKIDRVKMEIYFYDIEVSFSVGKGSLSNHTFKLLNLEKDRFSLRVCLCDAIEDATADQEKNCRVNFVRPN